MRSWGRFAVPFVFHSMAVAKRPVKIEARDGQQSGVVTKAGRNARPRSKKARFVADMAPSVPERWSSVTMTRMFGAH